MLNNDNIAYLENNGYKYILAANIKNIPNDLKEQISNLTFLNDGTIHTLTMNKEITYKDDNDIKQTLATKQRLVLTHSSSRAKKDKYTRTKALEKIQDKLSKNITKSDLKLSYYAKYLDIDQKCDIKYKLNHIEYHKEEVLGCGMQPKDWVLNKDLMLNSNLGQTITSAKTEQVFNILSSKLKSNNLSIKLNNYITLIDKPNQEASDFRPR